MHKYFAWKNQGGSWCGQKLVGLGSVDSLIRSVSHLQHFASIQTYDENGTIKFCPLYADLDHKEPEQSLTDARYIVYLLGEMSNVVPLIYFSGSKGFHIIIPHKIESDRCHLISRYFFEYLAKDIPSLDRSVYRTRAMLRLPGSPASKPGYFKTQLTRHELMTWDIDQIRELAKTRQFRKINEWDSGKVNDEFLSIIEDGTKNLPVYRILEPVESMDVQSEMTFCIEKILNHGVGDGERNQGVFLLARFFKRCNVPEQTALQIVLSHDAWKDYEALERGVSKVFKSAYTSRQQAMIGCRTGRDADLMKKHCSSLCWWNEHRMQIRFGRWSENPDAGWVLPSVSCRKTKDDPTGVSVFPSGKATGTN